MMRECSRPSENNPFRGFTSTLRLAPPPRLSSTLTPPGTSWTTSRNCKHTHVVIYIYIIYIFIVRTTRLVSCCCTCALGVSLKAANRKPEEFLVEKVRNSCPSWPRDGIASCTYPSFNTDTLLTAYRQTDRQTDS